MVFLNCPGTHVGKSWGHRVPRSFLGHFKEKSCRYLGSFGLQALTPVLRQVLTIQETSGQIRGSPNDDSLSHGGLGFRVSLIQDSHAKGCAYLLRPKINKQRSTLPQTNVEPQDGKLLPFEEKNRDIQGLGSKYTIIRYLSFGQ